MNLQKASIQHRFKTLLYDAVFENYIALRTVL
jgi:hypothetical protein